MQLLLMIQTFKIFTPAAHDTRHDGRAPKPCRRRHIDDEEDKELLVVLADAVVDPGAVVVHAPDAPLADAAVYKRVL